MTDREVEVLLAILAELKSIRAAMPPRGSNWEPPAYTPTYTPTLRPYPGRWPK